VLLLDNRADSEAHARIEVAMLPQEKNQREGNFIVGKLRGHIAVVVEKRRVIVTCTFRDVLNEPLQIAEAKALVASLITG
jgi:hypothetical protein